MENIHMPKRMFDKILVLKQSIELLMQKYANLENEIESLKIDIEKSEISKVEQRIVSLEMKYGDYFKMRDSLESEYDLKINHAIKVLESRFSSILEDFLK